VNEAPFEAALRQLAYHGGNLGAARRLCPDAPQPWIDLSTGINPIAYPLPALAPDLWTRLPEPDALCALEAAAARRYLARAESIVAASGTQTIIQWLARLRPAARVGILGFSYGGHARAWRAAGARVETVETIGALAAFDVAIVVNPNNPDGRLTSCAALLELHRELAARGGMLIVDEAFIDLEPHAESLAPALPTRNAIVLRSFGKTYGLGGLRLGFAIADAETAATLRASLGPWPVSGPAIAIGRAALADDEWLEEARRRLERDVARLDGLLVEAGFALLGGTHLFRLAQRADAFSVFSALLRQGILVRPFAEQPDRLRLGIPDDEVTRERLRAVIARERSDEAIQTGP
jgi:cobalamin biosynthesis protein CobC